MGQTPREMKNALVDAIGEQDAEIAITAIAENKKTQYIFWEEVLLELKS